MTESSVVEEFEMNLGDLKWGFRENDENWCNLVEFVGFDVGNWEGEDEKKEGFDV